MTIDAFEIASTHSEAAASAAAATHTHKAIFEDANLAVEAVVIAHQRFFLPPLRTNTGWHHQPVHHQNHHPAHTQNGAVEPVDPSIDDTPAAAAAASSTAAIAAAAAAPSAVQPASPSTAAPPAAKKAKFAHSHSHSGASSSASATAASSAAADSSSAAVPAAPRQLSYCCVNQSRENERQAAEWSTSTHPALVCYIATLASTPGKFDVARAKALGIPPGPLYAKLKAGESVHIKPSEMIGGSAVGGPRRKPQQKQQKKGAVAAPADEAPAAAPAIAVAAVEEELRTFHPSDCVATPIPGPKFAVIDCPNHAFLGPLVEHPAFRRFQDSSASSTAAPLAAASSSPPSRLTLMLHLTPMSLLSHPQYVSWLSSFGPGTQHVLAHATTSVPRAVFRSAALNYLKLQRYVNAEVFPAQIPVEDDSTDEAQRDAAALALRKQLAATFPAPLLVEPGVSLLRFHLLPPQNQSLDRSVAAAPVAYPSDVVANLAESSNPGLMARLEHWRAAMAKGAAEGKGVQQIADQIKQEMDAEAAQDPAAAVVAAAPNVTVGAPPPMLDFPLIAPAVLADYQPAADILAQLAAQPADLSPQLTFLGTGSAIPSKYRNVTGQFFHPGYESLPSGAEAAEGEQPAHPVGGFFFDCGEGSYGQLCLRYSSRPGAGGPASPPAHELVADLVADLKAVWVSHIHADHHLGLLSLLSVYKQTWMARYKAQHGHACDLKQMQLMSPLTFSAATTTHAVPKLLVVGPRRLYFWLKEYAACAFQVGEEDQVDAVDPCSDSAVASPLAPTLWEWVEFVGCSELQDRSNRLTAYFGANAPALAARYPCVRPRSCTVLQTVQVRHCNDAYGLVIETAAASAAGAPALPPFKLVISGDTQPCQALIDAGADATLLVHEATLEDDMVAEARDKRHSTTRQAIEVGLSMRAQRILLTHFSQRYPKIPSYSDSFSARTCLAFDLMCVRFRSLAWLPALTPAFSWLFSDDDLDKYENNKDKETSRNDMME